MIPATHVRTAALAAVLVVPAVWGIAETHRVEIRGLRFLPADVRAAGGDTVTWINDDIVAHTVTSDDGSWDSGEVPAGGRFSLPVSRALETPYHCRYHPTMRGTLRVE